MMKGLISRYPNPDWENIAETYFAARALSVEAPHWQRFWAIARNAVASMLIDPDSAKIEPQSGFAIRRWGNVSGNSVCFSVNAKNRFGGYVGSKLYAVVINDNGGVLKIDTDYGPYDGHVEKQCLEANLPPVNFVTESAANAERSQPLAEQLQSLADMRQRGLLTDAEFAAAKAKLLSGSQ